jgi:hypothetical protein
MSNAMLPPSRTGAPRANWDWSEKDAACFPPYSIRLPTQVSIVLTVDTGTIGIQGQAATFQAQTSTARGKVTKQPVPIEPPKLWWSGIARWVMSPTQYRARWLPHVADMHFEYSERMQRGDLWGARWAVLRAHFYSVPRGLWTVAGAFLGWLMRHWLPF